MGIELLWIEGNMGWLAIDAQYCDCIPARGHEQRGAYYWRDLNLYLLASQCVAEMVGVG